MEEFGYNPDSLKPNSCKLVYRICEVCQEVSLKKFREVNILKHLICLSCANKKRAIENGYKISKALKKYYKDNPHPMTGHKHSEETRAKMSKNYTPREISEDQRLKASQRMLGENNPFYGKKHTKKTREIMSEKAKQHCKRGSECNFYGKTFPSKYINYKQKDGVFVKLRSSWEKLVAEFLDKNNIKWDYEKEVFPVEYFFDGELKNGTYTPDFFLDDEVWEVKGFWRKDAKAKFDQFCKSYPDIKIKIIDKFVMIEMGLL